MKKILMATFIVEIAALQLHANYGSYDQTNAYQNDSQYTRDSYGQPQGAYQNNQNYSQDYNPNGQSYSENYQPGYHAGQSNQYQGNQYQGQPYNSNIDSSGNYNQQRNPAQPSFQGQMNQVNPGHGYLSGKSSEDKNIATADTYHNEKKHPADQYKTEADRLINKKIRSQTDGWFTDSFKTVVIRTSDGVVVIEGVVSSPADQKKLTDEIKKVEGVKAVQNNTSINAEQAYNNSNSRYGTQTNRTYAANAQANGDVDQFPNEKKYPADQFKTQSDRVLNKKIRNQTDGWFSDSFKAVIIRTSDGLVVIEGVVATPEEQKKLTDEIKKVEGVKAVQNNTTVNTEHAYNNSNSRYGTQTNRTYAANVQANADVDSQFPNEKKHPADQFKTQSDRVLNKKIRNQTDGWFTDSFKAVIIRTSDGLVVIEGVVATPEEQKKLTDEIKKVEGVKAVQNNTTVNTEHAYNNSNSRYGTQTNRTYAANVQANANADADTQLPNEKKYPQDRYQTQADRQLNKKIRDQITGWFTDHYKEVILQTADGTVVIEGFVASDSDKKSLNDEIKKIEGVKGVHDNSQIKAK